MLSAGSSASGPPPKFHFSSIKENARMRKFLPQTPLQMGQVYYTAKNGSDDNPGTRERPFLTISRGARELRLADCLIVGEGVYRETVELIHNGHKYVPESVIRIEAAPGAKVWVRGSEEFHANWHPCGDNVFSAPLPEQFFAAQAYNPFALALDFCQSAPVRPGSDAPVRGILWIDEEACLYRKGLPFPKTFEVSEDGKTVIVRFPDGLTPHNCQVEISCRRHCFEAKFPGPAFYAISGIDTGHAVEPYAFDGIRKETVHHYPTGLTITKSHVFDYISPGLMIPFHGSIARMDDNSIIAATPTPPDSSSRRMLETAFSDVTIHGTPDGLSWQTLPHIPSRIRSNFFFDHSDNTLYRTWQETDRKITLDMDGARWKNLIASSRDRGMTWSAPTVIPGDTRLLFSLTKLRNGRFMLFYTTDDPAYPNVRPHAMAGVMFADKVNGDLQWSDGGAISVTPDESSGGLDEPHGVQLADGRLLVLLRAGSRLPSDSAAGVTSGKLFSISNDGGMSWSKPRFLQYDDGGTVYSPRSYQDISVSSKNGRVYAVMSISPEPCWNCDPRNVLHIGEIDPVSMTLKRTTLTPIEKMCPDHAPLVRFSNWQQVEDANGDLLLFMAIGASEYCFVRYGWDRSCYCYRIEFSK